MEKKLKSGGKDTEHYFCARNITNSYFLKQAFWTFQGDSRKS